MSKIIQMDKILDLLLTHPLQLPQYDYGTAGFRYDASVMAPVMVRVGLVSRLLLLRSSTSTTTGSHQQQQEPSLATTSTNMGVMLTASHNDESYNGVKVAAPDGSMLDADQEQILIQWVNEHDIQQWKTLLQGFIDQPSTSSSSPSLGSWHVGRDTRSHSPGFSDLVIQAATFMGVSVIDHGILTTPMLHQIVLMSNQPPEGSSHHRPANRQTYLEQLAQAYCTLDQLLLTTTTTTTTTDMDTLQVDGACGVGYPAMVDLVAALHTINPLYAKRFQPRNPPGSGPLNEQCGSEHVQKQLMPPQWYDDENPTTTTTTPTAYACSVDGDADRIVFWSTSSTTDSDVSLPGWTLLDGDKIAVLMGQFFQQLQLNGDLPSDLAIGVVQTAYANGASTLYLKNTLKVPVVITKTGVKHLHHKAQEFDIGIYFEANGHGTVVFSDKYERAAQSSPLLYQLSRLINPAVGDALSDLLFVDLLLRRLEWTLYDWSTKLYIDLPSRQLKVKVEDRSMIVCNDNETQALEPADLQALLDQCSQSMDQGRCFVRPSGTENVVRIYAEASTRELADELATRAAQIVHERCRGVGPLPKI